MGGGAENTSTMPSLESMEYYMDFRYKTFHDSQLINACHNIQNTLIIDMSEIIGQKAFNTMQKLAKYCDFKEVSNTEKTFFEEKISQYEGVLPLACHIPQINVNIFITTKYWLPINSIISYEVASRYEGIALPQDAKDITGQILDAPHNKIVIAIKENEWTKLANCSSFSEIKAYINALIPHIEKQRQIEDSKALNEQHLLDYLKNNPLLSNKFDNILEEH
ncbi:DUF2972 domain-containing protein, partial [Helicobacter rodentium]|uniref:DUF2972 domain-containing protein n=1 Tax=Helicobacter rodentium TaxID=59617 RepID=UPI0023563DFC